MSDRPDPPLALRLFGPFEGHLSGVPLPRFRTRKGQWLLALLVLRPSAELKRDWLACTLWPESSASAALVNLRGSVKDLRRAFSAEAIRLRSPTKATLSLDLCGAEVDVLTFDMAIARGDPSSLEQAVALYRGSLLEGCTQEWIFPERQAREEAYLRALESLAARALASDDPASAERYLRRAVAADPLRESVQRDLMQVLASRGSYAAALQTYRDLRLRLHRDLNAGPDPQTQELFERIRAEVHRPLHSSPPAASDHPPAGNLPVQPTRLLGRERELAAIREMLSGQAVGCQPSATIESRSTLTDSRLPTADGSRLLTLTGPGGTGKTRLAVQAAVEQREAFGDGAFLVSLASIRDPDLVASAIAETLGVREAQGRPLPASLKEYLRQKEMLLLLDNFEQLLPAAPLVAELLSEAPRLRVLVTSRAALRLRGERLFPVSSLALPDRSCLPPLAALSQYAAVQLFIQRALDVRPEFAVTNENAPAVAEICHLLDGLPLAIELAAAQIRMFSPQALLSRLGSRLEVLIGGPRDAPARQQTLRNTIAWSYDLLNAGERQLFRRLAIFAGGFRIEAAEAIAASPPGSGCPEAAVDVVPGLISLLDQNLLREDEDADGQPRLGLLETIREFAHERLIESGEAERLRKQHAGCFLHLAEQAEPELHGPQAARWLERLEAEHDNLRAALSGAIESGDAETGLRLLGALAPFWGMRAHWAEGRHWAAQILALTGAIPRTAMRAKALAGAALMARMSDGEAAPTLYAEGLSIARECDDRARVARILEALGDLARESGKVGEARPLYNESLTLYQELGDRRGQAGLLMSMGLMSVEARDSEQTRMLLERSRAIYQELGDSWGVAAPTVGLSTEAALHEHDLEKARRYAEECLSIYRRLGARERTALSLNQLAEIALSQGKIEEAQALLEESLALARDLGDQWRIAHVLRTRADVALRQGSVAAAREGYEESLLICRAHGYAWETAEALVQLGHLALRQADCRAAEAYFAEGLACRWELLRHSDFSAVRRRFVHQVEIARCFEGLAVIAAAAGRSERAARLSGAAEALRITIGEPLPPADGAEGRWERAARLFGAAEAPSTAICGPPPAADGAEHERRVAVIRAALGKEAFASAWAEGEAMPLEQAIAQALEASPMGCGSG